MVIYLHSLLMFNIFQITNLLVSLFCVIKEDPIIYASKMDMEIADKTSAIEVKQFTSFSDMVDELKRKEFPIWLLNRA